MDPNCIFCKIAAKQIPATLVHEDDRAVAFRDINAVAPQHLLVIPREHITGLGHTTDEHAALLGHLLTVAVKIAKDNGLVPNGFRTVINTGSDGGQSVYHLHVHVLGGRQMTWPPG